MKRTLAGRAADTYVLASTEKLGAASRYQVLPLSAVTAVITDGSPGDAVAALAGQGVTVLPPRA
jgi:DeoR/GlpR family transcriptional regulator of sugar metabolism